MADEKKSKVLIVGASRGLGKALAEDYVKHGWQVYGTLRSDSPPDIKDVNWISNIDVATPTAGQTLTRQLPKSTTFSLVIISAGVFIKESFSEPDFDAQVQMYKISAIGPIFLVQALFNGSHLPSGSKIILISSEAGSITLRHEQEGGGNYGHHASKAALNMVGKLLSLDLKEHGIAVGLVHPAFMRTEMTKNVGFDRYWDEGGAVTPEESASSLREWVDKEFDISKTGEYWAPRGPRDIGTAEAVLGKDSDVLKTPMHLPW
ncbi:hypothetical protein BST61_g2494 [Cercospora zeina]